MISSVTYPNNFRGLSLVAYERGATSGQYSSYSSAPADLNSGGVQREDKPLISNLSRQLAESARRAEERDRTLGRSELADIAKNILSRTVGDLYYALKSQHDSELPRTTDPELVSRAKQATAYIDASSRGSRSIANPFAGLPREQLALIVYDSSGPYTVNERHAAWAESYHQEQAWREKVVGQGMNEYNSTGKMTNFFGEVLYYFKALPAIEQAQYPGDYAVDLQSKINANFNYRTHRSVGSSEQPFSLFELLFRTAVDESKENRATI